MKILITGASGLIGSHLTSLFLEKGFEVAHLGRKESADQRVKQFTWDPEKKILDAGAISWADTIVHLAGAGIADKRWSEKRKKEIIDSRVKSADLLLKTMREEKNKIRAIISASGIGWYGMITSDKIFTESDPPANDFVGECCKQWESSVDQFAALNLRVVKLRIGVVLAKEAGALSRLVTPVKWFVGSPLASGKQWMPWIHIDDIATLFLRSIEDEKLAGVYNAVCNEQIMNREFVRAIGHAIDRPVFLPHVPEFLLKIMFGEMSGIITEGSRVSNEKILETGFVFKYNELSVALKNLLK